MQEHVCGFIAGPLASNRIAPQRCPPARFFPAIVNDGTLAYPAPEQARISWLSHRTLAEFVYTAAVHPDASGRDLRVGGPEVLTGADLSSALEARLDRLVNYQRIPLDAFAAGLDQAFGAPAGSRIASLYARLDDNPDAMAIDGSAAADLGISPETFHSFIARQDWRAA